MVRLRDFVAGDVDLAWDATARLPRDRRSYRSDRAYRLLSAAVDGTAVRPIDPAVRDQFLAEARLGRMSRADAFELLASLEPRLRDLPAQRASQPSPNRGFSVSFGEGDPKLVGAWAESPHQILNTDLAANVVHAYLYVTRDGRQPETDPTPFFERRIGAGGGSFVLFGEDPRPRARS